MFGMTGEKNSFFGRKHSLETKRKMSEAHIGNKGLSGRTGEEHPSWKGGRRVRGGYVVILQEDGKYKGEHRIIAEEAIGRPLKVSEHIHHINGDRLDNRPQNLLICSRSQHMALERRMSDLYKKEHFTDAHNLKADLERVVDGPVFKRSVFSLQECS